MKYVIGAIVNIIILSLIPFIWWVITARKKQGFFTWIGLKKPQINNWKALILCCIVLVVISFLPVFVLYPLFIPAGNAQISASQFTGMGVKALIPALIWAFLQTGLSEEIFFRGFLNKRLVNKLGLNMGNGLQAILFGLLHGVMLFPIIGVVGALLGIIITGLIGWFMGLINEKYAGGSIVPSWIIHGLSNIMISLLAMFNLLNFIN